MKITIKTTQQKVFHVDVDVSETIASLKSKIQQSQGHPATLQKIIYSGKILPDVETIESCGIKEKDFLVLMVTKPKPMQASAPEPLPASVEQATASESLSTAAVASPTLGVAPINTTPASGDSSFLSGDALQTTIQNMVEMGFPQDQVLRALRASFNNPDRAVEYLMNGIPSSLDNERSTSTQTTGALRPPATNATPSPVVSHPEPQNLFQLAQQQQQPQQHPSGASNTPPDLSVLQDNSQIQRLRELVHQDPALLQPLIQQIASSNPALARLFVQDPGALLQLLGVTEQDDGESASPGTVVSVTEEERAAIERLEALGFPRHIVVEAYFACDKNEELAANYLFESGFDD
ncbi:hypothetical protein AX14_012766 [Amanita brunnescens Koide BX004]|nr:hypothetical protein AX14_012766 [Amanita brunnescens Koide BX004]